MEDDKDIPLFCHRCGLPLTPGKGNFYLVRITALADPAPPILTDQDLAGDLEAEIEKLLQDMRGMSEQELADQVYRRLTIYLCAKCYGGWIENPAS